MAVNVKRDIQLLQMVGKYERKSNRQSWNARDMELAVEAVQSGRMGWLKASKSFNVPHTTLRRRVQGKNKRVKGIQKGLGRYDTTFTAEQEQEIVDYLKMIETRMYGLTTTELRKLAFNFAEKNRIDHRFNKETQMAGWDWLKGFRERNPTISLRVPEATSLARAQGFNKPQINRFFDLLSTTYDKYKFPPERIFNMDESGLSTVQKPSKIFATKGRKQVGAVTSAERGVHTTVVCCMNPVGFYIPPALIFARKRFKQELIDGAPTGTLGLCQDSGWMTGPLFLKWLEHFVKYTNASLTNQVLLITDGHSSHKYYEALKYAKMNGVIILCIPPHCTHRIQPLDVAFFGPLTTFYHQEISVWMKKNPGRSMNQFQVGAIFAAAYGKAATVSNAASGFHKTGLYPLNRHIFPEWMFIPAETSNMADPDAETSNRADPEAENTDQNEFSLRDIETQNNTTPPTGIEPPNETEADGTTPQKTSSTRISLYQIAPLPVATTSGLRRKRRAQGSAVLNSTPNLEEIKTKAEEKKQQLIRKSQRKKVKKVLHKDSEDESEEGEKDFSEDEDEDAACIYCNELYNQSCPGEDWIRCQTCKKWCHTECAGVSKRCKQFICELCT